MSANDRQVGGDHYKTGGEEHWDRVNRLGLDYFQGQITKYVERWKMKGGLQDLEKARHFLDKYIELRAGAELNGEPTDRFPPKVDYHFDDEIQRFNKTFMLPHPETPMMHAEAYNRLRQFKKMLQEELDEVNGIMSAILDGKAAIEVLTDLADWLGDIQVYCASEMARWGIPLNPTLECIMGAQWSKLENGHPILKDGKVQKGPDYKAPEPEIRMMLLRHGAPEPLPADTRGRGHEDFIGNREFTCEGYNGDGTQLYQHVKDRSMWTARSLQDAVDMHSAGTAIATVSPPPEGGDRQSA